VGAPEEIDPEAVLPQIPETRIVESEDDDDDEADDEEEIPHPTAQRVMQRAMVLAAVTNRGFIELEKTPREEMEELRGELIDWIQNSEIFDEVEPNEWEILQAPVGSVPQQDTINAIWRLEGLGVLVWALKLMPLPEYDELVVTRDVQSAVGVYDAERAKELLLNPQLRAEEELVALGRQILALHWRTRNSQLHPGPIDFVDFSKNSWFGGFDISPFRVIKLDLAIGEKAISEADPNEVDRCNSAAAERHQAINWLRGFHRTYSRVGIDT
jgi:hypothetical protein